MRLGVLTSRHDRGSAKQRVTVPRARPPGDRV